MNHQDNKLLPEIIALDKVFAILEQEDYQSLTSLIEHTSPGQLADFLESMPPKERSLFWSHIPDASKSDVIVNLHDEVRAGLFDEVPHHEILAATENMEVNDLAEIIEDLPEPVRLDIEHSLSDEIREFLETNLSFPEATAGRLMRPDVVTVRADVKLETVLRFLKRKKELPQFTDALMVVDREGSYLGTLPINSVITLEPTAVVKEVMNTSQPAISANTSEHEVSLVFEQTTFVSAAVVDDENHLIGRITVDEVVAIIRNESEHALMASAGLDEEEDLFAPVFKSTKRRTVWLAINLVTAFLAAWVIGLFSAALEQIVALAVLMPIVASMGGIAGSQTLTLTIRGLALSQISSANSVWLARKEILIGILNGLLWSVVVALLVVLWFQNTGIGLVIGAAIIINLVAAAAAGIAIPLVLDRLGIDPALSGAVILTTVTDVIGFMSFLGLASLFLL